MARSLPQFPDRIAPALTLLAGILLGFLPACTRPGTTSRAEPQVAAPEATTRASDLTAGEIRKRPHESIASLLQARTPGVEVAENPDGSISVRIRGASSFYGSGEPLYVIDDMPIEAGPGGALIGVNPYEIETIKVLKHPPETTLYGVRGANGVIVIKTKRPKP